MVLTAYSQPTEHVRDSQGNIARVVGASTKPCKFCEDKRDYKWLISVL